MRWKLAAASALLAAGIAAMPVAPAAAWDGRYHHYYYGRGYGCCFFPFGLVGAALAGAAAIISAPFVIASAPFRQPYYYPPAYPYPGYYAPPPAYYYPPPGYQYPPSDTTR